MDHPIRKTYTNGDVTVVWQPHLCVHSAICFRGLPAVFDPRRRPWIDCSAASSRAISEQVTQCPSGALSLAPAGAPSLLPEGERSL